MVLLNNKKITKMPERRLIKLLFVLLFIYCMEMIKAYPKKRGPKKGTFKVLTSMKRSKIERLALEEGFSLNKIAFEIGGITREGVRYYLKTIGKHTEWKEKREVIVETKRERNELEFSMKKSLLNVLVSKMYSISYEDLPLKFTLNYFFNNQHTRHSFNKTRFLEISNLLDLYFYARDNDLDASLDVLAASSNIHIFKVSRVLSELGLETLVKPRLNEEGEKTVRRMFLLEMSAQDLAYFWGKHRDLLSYQFRKVENEIGYTRPSYYSIPSKRIESMVYEAQDAGLGFEEICELLGKSPKLVEKSVERREKDSKEIMYALDVIYLTEKHDKPYLHKHS